MNISIALDGTKQRDLQFFAGDDMSIVLTVYAHDGDVTPIIVTNVRFAAAGGELPLDTEFTVPSNYIGRAAYRIIGDIDGITTTLVYGVLQTACGWPSLCCGPFPGSYPWGVVGKAENITVRDDGHFFATPMNVEAALQALAAGGSTAAAEAGAAAGQTAGAAAGTAAAQAVTGRIMSPAAGTTAAITLATGSGITAYANNDTFEFAGIASSLAGATVKVDAGPAVPLYDLKGNAVAANAILAGRRYGLRYSSALVGFQVFPMSLLSLQTATMTDGKNDLSTTLRGLNPGDRARFYVMPYGAVTGNGSFIKAFGDDYDADPVNYRDINMGLLASSGLGGTTGPHKVRVNSVTGAFVFGETVTSPSGGSAKFYYKRTPWLYFWPITQEFIVGEVLTGATSGATATGLEIGLRSTFSPYGMQVVGYKTGSASFYRGNDPDGGGVFNDGATLAEIAWRTVRTETTEGSAYRCQIIFGPSAILKSMGDATLYPVEIKGGLLFQDAGNQIRWRNPADTANDSLVGLSAAGLMEVKCQGSAALSINSSGTVTLPGAVILKSVRPTSGTLPYVDSVTALALNPTAYGKVMTCTLTGNALLAQAANVLANDEFEIIFIVTAGGPFTVTFGTGWYSDVASFSVSAGTRAVLSVKCLTAGAYTVKNILTGLTLRS